jgi:hypothetical protein
MRIATDPPRRIMSPEQKGAPPTNKLTFDPTAFGKVMMLPGERERICRTAMGRLPSSASRGRERCA